MRTRARNWAGAAVKRTGETLGLEVRRRRPVGARRATLLTKLGVTLVIDVGANRGQYGAELRANGYRGRIVSLEPLGDAYLALSARANGDPQWDARRIAATDGDRPVELRAADNFSSLLPAAPELTALFPEASPDHVERVDGRRLDGIDLDLPEPPNATLLKLDVQGAETQVLAGAGGILDRITVIETEMSLRPLYAGQPLLDEVAHGLRDLGFALHGLEPVLRDRRTGEHLQFDGLFVRR